MKKTLISICVVLFVCCVSVSVKADLLEADYGVAFGKTEDKSFGDLFVEYFSEQLDFNFGVTGAALSVAVFNEFGVNPHTTSWSTTEGAELVGAYKVAHATHTMSLYDRETKETIATITTPESAENKDQIVDLSNQFVGNLPPSNVDVQLQVDFQGFVYNWSSDPSANGGDIVTYDQSVLPGDGKVHMIALDITDLYNKKHFGEEVVYESVYMFGWEDLPFGKYSEDYSVGNNDTADWDYNDLIAIISNIRIIENSDVPATPEPASVLIFGVGALGLAACRVRKNKKA